VAATRAGGSRDEAATVLTKECPNVAISTADFDAASTATHAADLDALEKAHGPFDTIIVAFGQLGDEFTIDIDPAAAADLAHVNYSGAVSATLASLKVLRGEPNARLIVFSSVAAVRPRVGNIVYGSAKAGLDAFVREITAPAAKVGVHVMLVRPGFVHTRMTEGLEAAPFATTADAVAEDMADGVAKGKTVVHSPAVLGPVGLVLKNLPGAIWRQISKR